LWCRFATVLDFNRCEATDCDFKFQQSRENGLRVLNYSIGNHRGATPNLFIIPYSLFIEIKEVIKGAGI